MQHLLFMHPKRITHNALCLDINNRLVLEQETTFGLYMYNKNNNKNLPCSLWISADKT